jgi:hypothetical protein
MMRALRDGFRGIAGRKENEKLPLNRFVFRIVLLSGVLQSPSFATFQWEYINPANPSRGRRTRCALAASAATCRAHSQQA